jgi:hypothetical protein
MPLFLASLLILLATSAAAQATGSPPSAPPLPSPSDPCTAAESDYTAAFEALIQGKDEEALVALEQVLTACPNHPYAGELARLARARINPGARLAESALVSAERPTGLARGGLVVWQTFHGAAQGALLCGIADCQGRGFLGASLAGAAIGATTSLLLTTEGITPGQSAVINSGTSWGVWYGLSALGIFDIDDDGELATVMSSMASLTAAGIVLSRFADPTAGQVSMANSGGLWAGTVMALFLLTSDEGDTETFFAIESAVTAVGLTSFALLSKSLPVSRGRVLLIDAGGILGGLLGAATVALFDGKEDALLIGAGVGALGGLGFATWLTRDFDAPARAEPQVTLAPTVLGRGGAGLVLGGRF